MANISLEEFKSIKSAKKVLCDYCGILECDTCTVQYLFESALNDCPDAIQEPDDELITNDSDSDNDWTEEGHMTLEEARQLRAGLSEVAVNSIKGDYYGFFVVKRIREINNEPMITLDYFGKLEEFSYKELSLICYS